VSLYEAGIMFAYTAGQPRTLNIWQAVNRANTY
jgi:hypothetical protein